VVDYIEHVAVFAGGAYGEVQGARGNFAHEIGHLLKHRLVMLAATGSVDENDVFVLVAQDEVLELGWGIGDVEGEAHDFAVGAKLRDGGNAIGVGGEEGDAALLVEGEVGGELGEGGGFADSGGADDEFCTPGGSRSQADGDAGSPEDQGSTAAATAPIDGIGENIDLRG